MILGIAGPAGAGKDTVADYLVKEHGFKKMKFGGPLRQMLDAVGLFEPADREAREQPFKGFDFSWRQAAQKLGTEFGRALDPDIWVKLVKASVEQNKWLCDNCSHGDGVEQRIVLSDVRFENESKMVRDLGGAVVHLLGRKDLNVGAGAHASEMGVLFWLWKDHLIDNSGSRVELHERIEKMLKAIRNA